MKSAIVTTRLQLRPARVEDVDALHALWTAPDVRRYLWDDQIISREQAAETVHCSLSWRAQFRKRCALG